MTITFDFSTPPDLTLMPKTKEEEAQQNLYCLVSTYLAEVPCYRTFGINKSYLSAPVNVASTMIVAAIADAVNKFYPGLSIESIETDASNDTMGCRIEVTYNEEL